MVCDGPKVNIAMMRKLGATISIDSTDTQILQDLDSPPIQIIHDMAHMIKKMSGIHGEPSNFSKIPKMVS